MTKGFLWPQYKRILNKPPKLVRVSVKLQFGINLAYILQACVHLWCFRGSLVTSVLITGLCELTDNDWDYHTTATSSMLASRCLAARTLMKNTVMQAWSKKTCTHTCTHTTKFYGVKDIGVLFVVPVTLLNFYDKCSMITSSPPSLCIAPLNFSLVR